MFDHAIAFAGSVSDHWVAAMSGIVALAVAIVQYLRKKKLSPGAWLAVGLGCLLLASYFAWNDQYSLVLRLSGQHEIHRHVTQKEAGRIKRHFQNARSLITVIYICSISTPEAQRYAQDFWDAFHAVDIPAQLLHSCVQLHDKDTGLMVGLRDPDHSSGAASEFLKRMFASGFRLKQTKMVVDNGALPVDFDLFIAAPGTDAGS